MFGLKRLREALFERIEENYRKHRSDYWELQNNLDALASALKLERQFTRARVEYVRMPVEEKNAN